jgi:hypothetical protein
LAAHQGKASTAMIRTPSRHAKASGSLRGAPIALLPLDVDV